MRKRLIERLTHSKQGSLGYTLTEMLVVIAIIAIACAIAIPSIFYLRDMLRFAQANNYAKSIFLAAQQNLTELRSDGGLGPIQAAGAHIIPDQVLTFPDEFRSEYVFTTTGEEAFSRILPVGSIDADLRDDQIVIEYNPITGNVYSVFYYSGNDMDLANQYEGGGIPREKSSRRPMLVGYYDGSGLNSSQIELEQTQAIVEFVNGQEGIVRVKIPMPESYFGDFDSFAAALDVDLSIYGEYSMAQQAQQALEVKEYVPLVIQMKQAGDNTGCTLDIDGRTIIMEYKIDSLRNRSSFANLASGTQLAPAGASNENEAALTTLADESRFTHDYLDGRIFQLLPGENITIQADVTFQGTGEDLVKITPGIVSNVNPMFDYLQPGSSEGRYDLAISNGRNLQNLNALSPTIAKMIDSVVFIKDINWNDTVNYYNSTYGTVEGASKIYVNADDEAPARALPHFVPIHNAALFGTAKFDYGVQNWANAIPDGIFKDIITSIFNPNSRVPTLTDEFDQETHAAIVGSDQENNDGIQIRNLNIDSTQNPIGGAFYAGTPDANIDCFTGLFSYANTSIRGIHVVNPIIKGYYFETKNNKPNNPATGALLGAGGYNTYIAECSAYLDTSDPTFSETKMLGQSGYSKETAQNWYGVSGEGAVGGLVGYAKSHRTVTGELEEDEAVLAFYKCFAAVNVSGNMREEVQRRNGITKYYGYSDKDYGYTNGIGGLVGNSELTNFYNCYASGNVRATNTNAAEKYKLEDTVLNLMANVFGIELELNYSGRESSGAGGFVGTSHGTRYTNCFATGTVTGTNSTTDLGIGGFVGVMCVDETFTYGNQNDDNLGNTSIAQRTVFKDCYSAGLVTSDGDPAENFSGANCRITFDIEEYETAQVADYYRLLGLHLHENNYAMPTYEDFYIYKDAYYLSKYLMDEEPNSNNCAAPAAYATLVNLPASHLNDTWITSQITAIKNIQLYNFLGLNLWKKYYGEEYFDKNGRVEGIYRQEYMKGFQNGWNQPTAATTHSYDMTGTFPFSKLECLEYYGDWPSKPLASGIAYYEAYEKNANGSYSRFYHFDRESTSQLETGDDKVVIKDGYAILSSTNGAMTITVEGVSKSFSNASPDDSYTANNKVYHVYLLTDAQMKAASDYVKATGQFYVPITFSQEGSTHTVYFNPNVAKSQVNGSYNHTFTDSNSDGSCNTCGNGKSHEYHLPTGKQMEIRSARQFAALSTMSNYISSDYYYVQKMHIDADQYQWTSSDDKKINSIGTAEQPFNTSYSGLYIDELTNEQKNYLLSGFQVVDAGIFGVIGETGSISNLTVVCTADMTAGSAEKENVAVLAGENRGSISFVDLTINGNASLTAKTNAGLLAGNSIGTVSDCTVTTAENRTVTLTASNAGGLIGNAEGTITRCGVAMNGTLQINEAVYAGCVLGHAVNTVCDQLIVSVKNLDASADIAAGLAGYAEGCTFSGSADASVTDVTVSGSLRSTGIASGVLGNAINTTLIGVDAGISEVSGSTAAGFLGVGDNVDATNCKVVITKSVTGTNGAAGVAGTIGSESVFNHVPVTLTGVTVSADGGNAAGYALEIKARAIVMGQSHVTLGGYQTSGNVLVPVNAAVIRGSQNAAGYACTVAGSVGEAHVVGCGQIQGGNAAGFAVEVSGSISDAFVSPALTQDDAGYLGNSNANLSVTGTDSAAGFVLNVAKNGSVSTAYTLCAVSSSGTIEIEKEPEPTEETTEPSEATDPSEATTAPTEIQKESVVSAYGFAGTNSGTISRSTANVDLDSGFGFVGVNNGLITTCYGWYGDGKDDSATTARGKIAGTGNCYSTYIAQLENQARDQKSVMVYDDDGLASEVTPNDLQRLSFSGFTSGYDAHPYAPMNPEAYPYPMLRAHYGNWVTPPEYAYGVAYYETYSDGTMRLHMEDLSNSADTMEQKDLSCREGAFDNHDQITEAGYAMFYNAAAGNRDGNIVLTKKIGDYTYNFYAIETANEQVIPVTTDQTRTAVLDTRFADAIVVGAEAFGADYSFQVRTPKQLACIGDRTASYSQTHDISTTDVTPARIAAGRTYEGNDLMLTISGQTQSWLSEVVGNVQNLALTVEGAVTSPIFGTVSGRLDLVGIQTGDISKSAALVDEASGSVSFGSIRTGAMSGHLINTITSGTVTTGNVELTSRTNTLIGTFRGGILRGSESEQRTIVVTDGTTLTSTLFCGEAGGEIRNYTITAPSQTGALAETMTASMSDVSVEVQVDASGVFLGSMSANMTSVTLKVDGTMNGSAIGEVITNDEKIPTLTNVAASGVNFGIVADKLDQGKTLDATVTVDTLTFTAAENSNIGGLVGVNAGSITGSTVTIQAAKPVEAEQSAMDQIVGLVADLFAVETVEENAAQGVTLNGAADFQTTFGGLTGSNSGSIESSKANVNVTYVQPTETTDKAILGGLVGTMNSGSIEGSGSNDATGSITLSGNGNGRAYVVGGAVGIADSGTFQTLTATIAVSDTWANGAYHGNVAGMDITAISPAAMGAVGKLVGYIGSGTFTNCAGNDQFTRFQFVGQVNAGKLTLNAHDASNTDWFSASVSNGPVTENANGSDTATQKPTYGSYTRESDGAAYYNYPNITLTNCTFHYPGSETSYQQILATTKYFYNGLETNVQNYTANRYGNLNATNVEPTFEQLHPQFTNVSGKYISTNYYYYDGNGTYRKVYVKSDLSSAKYRLTVAYKNGDSMVEIASQSESIWFGVEDKKFTAAILYANLTSSAFASNSGMFLIADSSSSKVMAMNADGSASAVNYASSFNTKDAIAKGIWQVSGNTWKNLLTPSRYLHLSGSTLTGGSKALTVGSANYSGESHSIAMYTIKGDNFLNYASGNFTSGNTSDLILYTVTENGDPYWNGDFGYASKYDQRCTVSPALPNN